MARAWGKQWQRTANPRRPRKPSCVTPGKIAVEQYWHAAERPKARKPPPNYQYVDELVRLQFELLKMQEWVRLQGLKVCVLFEGRDAAGKGGVIKRITECLNPRICRVVRWARRRNGSGHSGISSATSPHLPTAGEIVLFDRSWYNRAGVEHVMGFCNDDEYQRIPALLSVVRRHAGAIQHPSDQVLVLGERRGAGAALLGAHAQSDQALEAQPHGSRGAQALGRIFQKPRTSCSQYTDRKKAPWFIIDADNKKRARLNCIAHLLHQSPV